MYLCGNGWLRTMFWVRMGESWWRVWFAGKMRNVRNGSRLLFSLRRIFKDFLKVILKLLVNGSKHVEQMQNLRNDKKLSRPRVYQFILPFFACCHNKITNSRPLLATASWNCRKSARRYLNYSRNEGIFSIRKMWGCFCEK